MKRLTIKQRVGLWYTAMLLLITALVFFVLQLSSTSQASAYAAETLNHAARSATDEISVKHGEIELDKDLDDIDSADIMIYDEAGRALLYGRVPDFDLSFSEGPMRQVVGDSGRVWHVYDMKYTPKDGYTVWVRSGLALDSISNVATRTITMFAWMTIPLALLAALGGYLITRRAFVPVLQIADTARNIIDGNDLSRRIGLDDQTDEFGQLAGTFDDMFARLQHAFEQEKRFSSDASHELRTPLSVILTQCDYALSHSAENQKQDSLLIIQKQAERMSLLVDQLLMLSRMDNRTQPLHPEEIDLSELVESVVEELSSKAAHKQISFELDIQPNVRLMADELLLMRLLINLIQNAIRFGKPGGFVRLTLHLAQGSVVGTVEDNGAGISPDDLPHIWERFYQADGARTTGERGSGLGLSMVRWIVAVHHGAITVTSKPGKGSVFRFTFPCVPPDADMLS